MAQRTKGKVERRIGVYKAVVSTEYDSIVEMYPKKHA